MINQTSKKRLWAAWLMSGIAILFMLFDSLFKFIQPGPVVETMLELGYSEHHIAIVGLLGLISVILYTIPRTAILGAILLTGFFGGAIATNFRMDYPLFSHVLFPVYIAILAWGGLWLRNRGLQELVPLNSTNTRSGSTKTI